MTVRTEQAQRVELQRMRRLATGLLLFMTIIFLLAHRAQDSHPALAYVRAFAEAAMVGALADWFAVTALFRHPLGLPIPHTAVIPTSKNRIGDAFARFLERNFLTPQVIEDEIRRIDFARAIAGWLRQPANIQLIATRLQAGLPFLLQAVEAGNLGAALRAQISGALRNTRLAPFLAEALSVLIRDRRHQFVLEYLVNAAADTLQAESVRLRETFVEHGPWWLPRAIDKPLFDRLLDGVQGILQEIREEDSEWRARFNAAAEDLVERLRHDPAYEEKISTFAETVLEHPVFHRYTEQVLMDFKGRLLTSVAEPDPERTRYLERVIGELGERLLGQPEIHDRINHQLHGAVSRLLIEQRGEIAALTSRVIHRWDAQTMADKFELQVGTDLQYIRINGTLVGGMVGLGLHVLAQWL